MRPTMTSTTTRTTSTAPNGAELADAIAQRSFHRLTPDWLDIPVLARDRDALMLAHVVVRLRCIP
ncbi:hypothetical protein Slala05_73520 [Streptomyces lavendulae subsp. lavendulae]|nr:hypothetical protein Slala05_73520 [Streptomyces lavendulae subsp. lavendulae]